MKVKKRILSALLTVIMLIGLTPSIGGAQITENSKTVEIFSINDFHGNLAEDTRETGKNMGLAKIVDAIRKYKKANPNTIVVSAGDSYQGSAMSNLTHGAPVSEMYKEMGVIASSVGNHEFDWGIEWVKKWSEAGNFEFLATNIIDKNTNEPVSWAKAYKIVEVDGVKIAFIGFTTPETEFKTLPENVKDYTFQPLKESAEKWVKYLKSGEAPEGKADAIIALTHVGSFQDRESKEITGEVIDSELTKVQGLDGIITAHTHQGVEGKVDDVAIVQGYKYGRALGKLTLKFDNNNKLLSVDPSVDYLYKRKGDLASDTNGEGIYNKYNDELKPILGEVVGETTKELSHNRHGDGGVTILGAWVTDVMRKQAGTQIAVTNEGGLRTSIPEGEITVGKLYEVMPFDNTLVTSEVTGEQLAKIIENGLMNKDIGWIEISGAKVYYNPEKEMGSRINGIVLDGGEVVKPDGKYTVATNDFMFSGGDKYDFSGAENVKDTNKPIRDVIIEEIRNVKEIDYQLDQPLIAGDMPEDTGKDEDKGKDEDNGETKNDDEKEEPDKESDKTMNFFLIIIFFVVGVGVVVALVNRSKDNKEKNGNNDNEGTE